MTLRQIATAPASVVYEAAGKSASAVAFGIRDEKSFVASSEPCTVALMSPACRELVDPRKEGVRAIMRACAPATRARSVYTRARAMGVCTIVEAESGEARFVQPRRQSRKLGLRVMLRSRACLIS